jgi:hypothetical protein
MEESGLFGQQVEEFVGAEVEMEAEEAGVALVSDAAVIAADMDIAASNVDMLGFAATEQGLRRVY